MHSEALSLLVTASEPSRLIPYATVTVDMGQYLARLTAPKDLEILWIAASRSWRAKPKLARPRRHHRGDRHPSHRRRNTRRDTVLRRGRENFKKQKLVWLTNLQAPLRADDQKL